MFSELFVRAFSWAGRFGNVLLHQEQSSCLQLQGSGGSNEGVIQKVLPKRFSKQLLLTLGAAGLGWAVGAGGGKRILGSLCVQPGEEKLWGT